MPSPIGDLLAPAVRARALLWANHVLAAHPLAPARLRPHAGRRLAMSVAGLPRPPVPLPFDLPEPGTLSLRITPAGLLEWPLEAGEPDLRLTLDAADPLQALQRLMSGEVPPVSLQGDAALAADVSWVLAHVRWDVDADVERLFGPVAAARAQRARERLQPVALSALRAAHALAQRWRSGGA